jgi:hypothetical protein
VTAGTVVLQSQRVDRLAGWQGRCTASVAAWADRRGFAYRLEHDECFERVPADLRRRFAAQPVVLSDLARLYWLREVLEDGCDRALWVDADVLVFRDFAPPTRGDYLGRETWVQARDGRLRSYRKVHNAWLQFERESSFLPFYLDRAVALLRRAEAPVVPQFIGPKLLTAWHNLVPFAVEERIGMAAPPVLRDLLAALRSPGAATAGTQALRLLRAGHAAPLCGLNLCASYEGREDGGIRHEAPQFHELIDGLEGGALLAPLDAADP